MSVVIITGPPKSGKSLIANALRNNQISNKHGALLIDEANDGAPDILLEKILIGEKLPQPAPKNWAESLPWKLNAMVILVGDQAKMLDVFEGMLPGFAEHFGPVYTVSTGVA